jgi:hypothetical protein
LKSVKNIVFIQKESEARLEILRTKSRQTNGATKQIDFVSSDAPNHINLFEKEEHGVL